MVRTLYALRQEVVPHDGSSNGNSYGLYDLNKGRVEELFSTPAPGDLGNGIVSFARGTRAILNVFYERTNGFPIMVVHTDSKMGGIKTIEFHDLKPEEKEAAIKNIRMLLGPD